MTLDTSQLHKHDKVYHQLTYDILTSPRLNYRKADRVVIDTMGVFGNQVEYDLSDNTIPLSNTKNIGYKTQLFPEVVGFMKNENNLKWYLDQGMNIWTANGFNFYRKKLKEDHPWKNLGKDTPEFNEALKEYKHLVLSGTDPLAGDLGEFYPRQWRSFKGVNEKTSETEIIHVDQMQDMIDKLINQPSGRYALVTAWNPYDVKTGKAALAPCHVLFQAYRYEDVQGIERLDMKMFQRSADHHLGVAFNAPQYAAVTSTIANIVGVQPGRFIHTFGDLHLYIGTGERSNWYKNRNNMLWLQDALKNNHPNQVLEELLKKLPSEGEFLGYDHIPFAIQQLGKTSNSQPATIDVHATSLNNMEVSDLEVKNYVRPSKLELIYNKKTDSIRVPNGEFDEKDDKIIRPGMAS